MNIILQKQLKMLQGYKGFWIIKEKEMKIMNHFHQLDFILYFLRFLFLQDVDPS